MSQAMTQSAGSGPRVARFPRAMLTVVTALLLAFTDRGASAADAPGGGAIRLSPVGDGPEHIVVQESTQVVRWQTQRLPAGTVAFELSTDRGATWTELGRAPSGDHQLTWRVDGPTGAARVRLAVIGSGVRSRPKAVWIAPAVRDVQFSGNMGASLQSDGTVRIWGSQPQWIPPLAHPIYRPKALDGLSDIVSISLCGKYLLAVRSDGAVLEWGDRTGEGDPSAVISTPRVVEGISDAEFVRTLCLTSFVRLHDGRTFAWGDNTYGFLGDGTDVTRDTPIEIPALNGATEIQLGNQYGMAIAPDGSLLTWGDNEFGTLGDGTTTDQFTPTAVAGIADAVAVVATYDMSMALTRDGRVFTWGRDQYLALGRDAPGVEGIQGAVSPSPGEVLGLGHAVAIGGCNDRGFAVRDDGVVFGWGDNEFGFVGDGTFTPRPRPVACLLNQAERFYGGCAVLVITTDGSRWIWGTDDGEILGNGKRIGSLARPRRIIWK